MPRQAGSMHIGTSWCDGCSSCAPRGPCDEQSNGDWPVGLPQYPHVWTFPLVEWLRTRRLRGLGIPYLLEIHGVGAGDYRAAAKSIRGAIYAALEDRALRGAIGIVAVTEELRRAAIDRVGMPIPSIVIGNAADIELVPARSRSEVRARVGTPLESPVMVMAGVEAPWHGTDLALRILERLPLPDAELWLIGITQPSVRNSIDRDAKSVRDP